MTEQTQPESAIQRFRKKFPRIDYYPDWASLEALEKLRKTNPGKSTRVLLDYLVTEGVKATFPAPPSTVSGNTPPLR